MLRWIYGESDAELVQLLKRSNYRTDRTRVDANFVTQVSGVLLVYDSALTVGKAADNLLRIHLAPNTEYGMNYDYLDLSSEFRIMVCSIFELNKD